MCVSGIRRLLAYERDIKMTWKQVLTNSAKMEMVLVFDVLIKRGIDSSSTMPGPLPSKPQRQNQIMNKKKTPTGECLKDFIYLG